MHKILFYNKIISRLYMFRAQCAHYQEVKIALHSLWYHHTYRCDDTHGARNMIESWNKLIVKQNFAHKVG